MRVVGTLADGAVAFDAPLEHGKDPDVLAFETGYVVERPLSAGLTDSELRLVLRVRPVAESDPAPRSRRPGRDRGLRVSKKRPPVVRQRLAAYAVVQSERGLLATEYSALTAVAGRWGMPGGGIEPGEDPEAAVLREVVEETGQFVQLDDLVLVQSSHWVGRSPRGPVEDFHAVRLVYRGTCAEPTEPVVHDQGGTTESARWVPLAHWRDVTWTQNWRQALRTLLPRTGRTSGAATTGGKAATQKATAGKAAGGGTAEARKAGAPRSDNRKPGSRRSGARRAAARKRRAS
jgi:8-oxo-dGTP pyrophosphatase MutT (NUDIX family)